MMRLWLWILLVLQLPLAAQRAPVRYVDRAQLMRDLTVLASAEFEGRRTGTPGALKARQWIVEQFRTTGGRRSQADVPFEQTFRRRT
jgi:hypothetical protein